MWTLRALIFCWILLPLGASANQFCQASYSELGGSGPRLEFGPAVVPKMKDMLRSAEREILLEWRDFPPEEIVDLLISKKKAGLTVRVILDGRDLRKSADVVAGYKDILKRFDEAGVEYVVSNLDELSRYREYPRSVLHRKFILVDNDASYVGSANIGKYQENYEIGLFRNGSGTRELRELFELDFASIQGGWKGAETTLQEARFFSSDPEDGVRLIGPGTGRPDIRAEVLDAIQSAKTRLWISSFEASDPEVLAAIVKKKKDFPNLDIRVVLCEGPMSLWMKGKSGQVENSNISKNSLFFRTLLKSGIPVRAFSEPKIFNHSRFLVTENEFIGMSGDFTKRSFEANVELGFRSDAKELVSDGAIGFDKLWQISGEATLPPLKKVLKEKLFEWYQDYVGFRIRRNHPKPVPRITSEKIPLTYGIEIEYELDSPVLNYYRLSRYSDLDWQKMSEQERKNVFSKFVEGCKKIIATLFDPACKKNLQKVAGSPDWLPPTASFELHGTVELSGFVFRNLEEVEKFFDKADPLLGVGYYQGHVVWPKKEMPGLFGYLGYQYDKSALMGLKKGYEKWLKAGDSPAKSFARKALGYPDQGSAVRIRERVDSLDPETKIGKGGNDRLLNGPAIRDDVYPEGWVGAELRQFHRNPRAMLAEMKLLSGQLERGSFDSFLRFDGFQGVSSSDVANVQKYVEEAKPADIFKFLQTLNKRMLKEKGLMSAGSSSFADRFLLPLKDWEFHPILMNLPEKDLVQAQEKIRNATKSYVESLMRLQRIGVNEQSEDEIRLALSKWAYESDLSRYFEAFEVKK